VLSDLERANLETILEDVGAASKRKASRGATVKLVKRILTDVLGYDAGIVGDGAVIPPSGAITSADGLTIPFEVSAVGKAPAKPHWRARDTSSRWFLTTSASHWTLHQLGWDRIHVYRVYHPVLTIRAKHAASLAALHRSNATEERLDALTRAKDAIGTKQLAGVVFGPLSSQTYFSLESGAVLLAITAQIGIDPDKAGFVAKALVEMMTWAAYHLSGNVRLPIVGRTKPAGLTHSKVEQALASEGVVSTIRAGIKEGLGVDVELDELRRALGALFSADRANKAAKTPAKAKAKAKAKAARR